MRKMSRFNEENDGGPSQGHTVVTVISLTAVMRFPHQNAGAQNKVVEQDEVMRDFHVLQSLRFIRTRRCCGSP